MKKLLIVLTVVMMVGGLTGGLSAYAFNSSDTPDNGAHALNGPDSADNGPPDVVSARKLGDIYEVSLDSNPSTGYQWQVEFDEDFLEMVDHRFEFDSDTNPPLPGTAGKDTFVFRAVAKGNTRVEFTYKRPWETESLETKVYALDIS